MTESAALARRVAQLADAKRATDVVAVDVRDLVVYTDFLVICTARNDQHARAVHDHVATQLKASGERPARVEGQRTGEWIVADYLACVLHVFTPAAREHYRLEQLWGEGGRLELDLPEPVVGADAV